jgi:hypothetical protein
LEQLSYYDLVKLEKHCREESHNVVHLILALNEDNDIEEQQQTLEVIDSSAGVSI